MIFKKLREMRAHFKAQRKVNKGWGEISVGSFMEIERICDNSPEDTKDLELQRLIYGEERGDISFLSYMPEVPMWKDHYTINGVRYNLKGDISSMTTSQYIDFIRSKTMTEYLSVILIPDKHSYNDGYDIEEVKRNILDMRFLDAKAIVNFLSRQFQLLSEIMLDYLQKSPSSKLLMSKMTDQQKRIYSQNMEKLTSYMESVTTLI